MPISARGAVRSTIPEIGENPSKGERVSARHIYREIEGKIQKIVPPLIDEMEVGLEDLRSSGHRKIASAVDDAITRLNQAMRPREDWLGITRLNQAHDLLGRAVSLMNAESDIPGRHKRFLRDAMRDIMGIRDREDIAGVFKNRGGWQVREDTGDGLRRLADKIVDALQWFVDDLKFTEIEAGERRIQITQRNETPDGERSTCTYVLEGGGAGGTTLTFSSESSRITVEVPGGWPRMSTREIWDWLERVHDKAGLDPYSRGVGGRMTASTHRGVQGDGLVEQAIRLCDRR